MDDDIRDVWEFEEELIRHAYECRMTLWFDTYGKSKADCIAKFTNSLSFRFYPGAVELDDDDARTAGEAIPIEFGTNRVTGKILARVPMAEVKFPPPVTMRANGGPFFSTKIKGA